MAKIDMNNKLYKCRQCDLPETHETIDYDKDGTCNLCNSFKYKERDIN